MRNTLFCFTIKSSHSLEEAWEELELAGMELLYGDEEKQTIQIYGYWKQNGPLPHLPSVYSSHVTTLPSIDWEQQWQNHAPGFQDGYLTLDLNQFCSIEKKLKLLPGPGFGDLSHPTTRLMLKLLGKYLKQGMISVDVGCGSGILSLAAIGIGAEKAIGIDIDLNALEHARTNACINHLEKQISFCLPHEFSIICDKPLIWMMNMISSEQLAAWPPVSHFSQVNDLVLTSGVHEEERKDYLIQSKKWNWQLIEEIEESQWLGFVFSKKL